MKKLLIFFVIFGVLALIGCASKEPEAATLQPASTPKQPEGDQASPSNQQLTINPDYKGN